MAEKLHAETDTQQSSEDSVLIVFLTVWVRCYSVTFDLQYMDYLCLNLNAVVAVDVSTFTTEQAERCYVGTDQFW